MFIIFSIYNDINTINIMKETKDTYNYYVCVKTGVLLFNIPKFKDKNITFEAKGTLREDKTKEFGVHLC